MAGKTLPGIGEDESGEHETGDSSDVVRAGDKSNPGQSAGDTLARADKTPSVRPTDRMPMGVATRSPSLTPSHTRTILGGPAIVDDDKVAEGLKRLRSLDEPLGPIPNSTPTLKEGMPVVPGLPVPVTPAIQAADLLRSRGTAHGHALSTPAVGQGLVPMTVDDRMKGTLLGHSLHLPDLPSAPEENRAPEVRSVAVVAHATPAGSQTAGAAPDDFSHGDSRFFESEPVNTELEPEHPRSTKVVRGVAIFTAVISVFIVAAFAWSHSHKSDGTQAGEPEAKPADQATPSPGTATVDNNAVVPSGESAAAGMAAPAAAPPAAVAPPPAPTVAPAASEEAARAAREAEEAAKAETPVAKLKREVAKAAAPKPTPTPTPTPRPRSPRSTAESSHSPPVSRPAAASGKRAKAEEDPDGTLPLTE